MITANAAKNITWPALPPVINILKVIEIAKKVRIVLNADVIGLSKSNLFKVK